MNNKSETPPLSSLPRLRIAHVITRMIVGGAQENTLFSIIEQVRAGHHVVLVTGNSPGREGELLKNTNYPVFEVIKVPELVREISPLQDIKAYRKLRQIFELGKFDVVHTHSSKAGILGRIAAWRAKVPVVVHTVHGQAFHPYEKPLKNILYKLSEKLAARHCHHIYSVAQAMIDQCVHANIAPHKKYQVVYSGMDIDKFLNSSRDEQLRNQLGIPSNAQVLGTVARLFELKGYEFFIPMAIQLAQEYDNVHFLIVGDGKWHDRIKQQIEDANLVEKFHFAGLVAPDKVQNYIAQMDVLFHLSLREGLPRSVVQSLACGVPAVGFNLDGTPEVIIDGQTGFCIEPKSLTAALEAGRKLLDDPKMAKRMGLSGRDLVKDKFDFRYMARELEASYYKLLGPKHLSSSKPRLLLVIPRLNMGGAETCTYDLAKGLLQRGYDLHVVSGGGQLARKLQKIGVHHHWYSMRSMLYLPDLYLRYIIAKYHIELVHAHSNGAIIASTRALRKHRIPLIGTCHGAFTPKQYAQGLFLANKLICVSESSRNFQLNLVPNIPPKQLCVIYNGIDMSIYPDALRKRNAHSQPFRVGLLSRIRNFSKFDKGHYTALNAMLNEPEHERNWELHIYGKGRAVGQVLRFVKDNNLNSRVFFHGVASNVPKILGELDCVVLGSSYETFGLILAEAAAARIPQVSFSSGGTIEIIEEGKTGFLVKTGNGLGLIEAIEKLKNNRDLSEQMGQNARARVQNLFTLSRCIDVTIDCYKQVLTEFNP